MAPKVECDPGEWISSAPVMMVNEPEDEQEEESVGAEVEQNSEGSTDDDVDPYRITKIFNGVEVIAFALFKNQMDTVGSLGTEQDITALIEHVIESYKDLTDGERAECNACSRSTIQMVAQMCYLIVQNQPEVYEQWKLFKTFVECKATHVFAFANDNNIE